jgi:hypothetical protein
MLSPASLFRMMTEMIFVLLGGFLVWAGLIGKFLFNPRTPGWLLLGAVLIYWGARTWIKTMRAARTADRMANRIGGASLSVVGIMMLGLGFVELRWIGVAVAIIGGILIARGLTAAVLSLRAD